MKKASVISLLFLIICIIFIVIFSLFLGITFKGHGMRKWYDCPVDFTKTKTLIFDINGKSYFLRSLRIQGTQDLSRMWGGFPGDRNKYVAVSIETDCMSYPLLGRMASFLDVNSVEVDNHMLILSGGDGGGTWTAELSFYHRNDEIFFVYEAAKDERCTASFRL